MVDEGSKKLIDSVVNEDDILEYKVTSACCSWVQPTETEESRCREDRGKKANE